MLDTVGAVRAYFKAYADRNRTALEELLSSDFRFTSPYDDNLDKQAYFERCWPNSKHLKGHDIKRICSKDNEAYVTYECETKDGKRFRNTEFLLAKDGQVTDVEVYFGWTIPRGRAGGKG